MSGNVSWHKLLLRNSLCLFTPMNTNTHVQTALASCPASAVTVSDQWAQQSRARHIINVSLQPHTAVSSSRVTLTHTLFVFCFFICRAVFFVFMKSLQCIFPLFYSCCCFGGVCFKHGEQTHLSKSAFFFIIANLHLFLLIRYMEIKPMALVVFSAIVYKLRCRNPSKHFLFLLIFGSAIPNT